MANTVVCHSPDVLRWARERSGLTVEEVAKRLHKTPETVAEWEDGQSAPTYIQLESLAYDVYKRPLALFFLPAPPAEVEPEQEFRTLSTERLQHLSADTRLAIRQAMARQMSIRELSWGQSQTERQISKELRLASTDNTEQAALLIRQYLNVPLERQLLWTADGQALREWRKSIEDVGVFVFKRPIKQSDVTGFCLVDDEFPVIYLSSSTTQTHQVFTLFHELAHVLLSISGITFRDSHSMRDLAERDREIEIFCNRVAGDILIPHEDFVQFLDIGNWDDETTATIAERYHVSRAVVLHRALEHNLVSVDFFLRKAAHWAGQTRKEGGGYGNYYTNQLSYAGESYLLLAFSGYRRGQCSLAELADHIGVKAANIPKLEDRLFAARGRQ